MPDEENPPSLPPPVSVIPKKETVRITLPPKPMEITAAKRETVRIGSQEVAITGPKKETTRLPAVPISGPSASTTPIAAAKPMAPPPPGVIKPPGVPTLKTPGAPTTSFRPPGAPGAPTSPLRPPGAPGAPAPRPPSFGVKPSLGVRPPGAPTAPLVPPPAPTAAAPAEAEVKSAIPKKETARIQVPPQAKPMVPKATVKVPMAQPLPTAATAASLVPVSSAGADVDEPAAGDPLLLPLSIAALIVSLASVALAYLAYAA